MIEWWMFGILCWLSVGFVIWLNTISNVFRNLPKEPIGLEGWWLLTKIFLIALPEALFTWPIMLYRRWKRSKKK